MGKNFSTLPKSDSGSSPNFPISGIVEKAAKKVYKQRNLVILKRPIRPKASIKTKIAILNEEPSYLARFLELFPEKADLAEKRINDGILGVAILSGKDEIVASVWVSTRDYYEPFDGFLLKLEKGQAYEFDGRVTRLGKINKTAFDGHLSMWSRLYEMGFREILSITSLDNIPAIKFHLMMGFQETGRMFVSRWFLGGRIKFCREETCDGPLLTDYIDKTDKGRSLYARD